MTNVVADQMRRWQETLGSSQRGRAAVEEFIRGYLSARHRDHPETGCPSAALLDEIGRCDKTTRRTYTKAMQESIDAVAAHLSPDDPAAVCTQAIGLITVLVASATGVLSPIAGSPTRSSNRHPQRPILSGVLMTLLAGQNALVTGANRGMGREYVTQLLDRGVATVYATARDPRSIDHADPVSLRSRSM